MQYTPEGVPQAYRTRVGVRRLLQDRHCRGETPGRYTQKVCALLVPEVDDLPVSEVRQPQACSGKSHEDCSVWCEYRKAGAAHRERIEDQLHLQYSVARSGA